MKSVSLVFVAVLAAPTVAFPTICRAGEPEADAHLTTLRPPPDSLTNHFIIAPRVAWLIPLGAADDVRQQLLFTGTGVEVGVDLAYGVSRYVAVRAQFGYGWLGPGSDCSAGMSCYARSTSVGAGAEYHLVEGASLDPWISYGVGYRFMSFTPIDGNTPGTANYSGFEWMRLTVGGDWYPSSMLGFGPYVEFDAGEYQVRPNSSVVSWSNHTFFSLGMRGVFDFSR